MSEEASGILSGDAVERGRECLFKSLNGAHGDPAEVGVAAPERVNDFETADVSI